MGWSYCPNCKHKVSSKAVRCLYCGYWIKEDPYQARRIYFNRFFYAHFIIGITLLVVFISLLLQHPFQYILLVIIVTIILLAMIWGYKLNNKQRLPWDGKFIEKPSKDKKRLPDEERYYYKGKTKEQLRQYNEALQCYNNALELNPDFELAKDAKKKLKRLF